MSRKQASHGLGERFGSLLWNVVAYSRKQPMFVRAGEVGAIVGRHWRAHTVVAALEYDSGDCDRRLVREEFLLMLVSAIAVNEPIPVPVGVDHNVDEVGVVQAPGARRKRRGRGRPRRRPRAPE